MQRKVWIRATTVERSYYLESILIFDITNLPLLYRAGAKYRRRMVAFLLVAVVARLDEHLANPDDGMGLPFRSRGVPCMKGG